SGAAQGTNAWPMPRHRSLAHGQTKPSTARPPRFSTATLATAHRLNWQVWQLHSALSSAGTTYPQSRCTDDATRPTRTTVALQSCLIKPVALHWRTVESILVLVPLP